MNKFLIGLRSAALWAVEVLHFAFGAAAMILLSFLVEPGRLEAPLRAFCRNVVRLAGVRYEVRVSPGFDASRPSFFVPNHVNLFDPFVLYPALPGRTRGLELESHFRIPFYGRLVRRFGNVPVPKLKAPSDLMRMWRRAKAALDCGLSLVVFPEGTRTRTGRVGPFKDGVFRMAVEFGAPITPVTIEGAFAFNNRHSWLLRPSRIVVHVHDTIDTTGLTRRDVPAMMTRVRAIIAGPVGAD